MVAKKNHDPPATSCSPSSVEAKPIPGLPFASEKAATVLGLKVSGLWTRHSRRDLSAQWGCSPEAVDQVAVKVDAILQHLAGSEPTRKLVVHQLLLALRELDQVHDPAKRIALRVKVVSELSKVTGLVKTVLHSLPGAAPQALTDQLLGAS